MDNSTIEFSSMMDEQIGEEVATLRKSDLMVLLHGREEHNKLIRTCSQIVKEEDGSDLIPNWCRVGNAIRRILIKQGILVRLVRDAQDIMNRNDVHDSEWAECAYRECPTDFSK